jgi:hypothetical protein
MRAALLVAVGLVIGLGAGYGKGPSAQGTAGKLDLVVVCHKCIPDAMPQEAYNSGDILLDQNTGDLWFYPALSPGVKPRLLGTLGTPGKPLSPPRDAITATR